MSGLVLRVFAQTIFHGFNPPQENSLVLIEINTN
jgi:hypothetical protein